MQNFSYCLLYVRTLASSSLSRTNRAHKARQFSDINISQNSIETRLRCGFLMITIVQICCVCEKIWNKQFDNRRHSCELGVPTPNLLFLGPPVQYNVSWVHTSIPAKWHHSVKRLQQGTWVWQTDKQTVRPRYGNICSNRRSRFQRRRL